MQPTAKKKKDPTLALAAGCVAGSIEATATWPLEYVKTQMQAKRKVSVGGPAGGFVSVPQPYTSIYSGLRYTVRTHGAFALFTGLTPTLLFSVPKAGIRFGVNQRLRNALRSADGNVTVGASFASGMLAGVAEALLVVTPMETIKTKLIGLNMRTWHGLRHIVATQGAGGLYCGSLSTCLKQGGANGARFLFMSEYTRLLTGKPEATLRAAEAFPGGVGAGLFSVLLTQPFDVVKTRMQARRSPLPRLMNARLITHSGAGSQSTAARRYAGTADCVRQIVRDEGAATLYSGTVARCARVNPLRGKAV